MEYLQGIGDLLSAEYLNEQDELIRETKILEEILSKDGCCVICFYNDNPLILEKHHIAGKNNSVLVLTVCPNCHRILSKKQESWNNDWIKNDNSEIKKLAFTLMGRSEVLEMMAKIDKEFAEKILKGSD
jgi:hypothetical protein